MVMIELSETEKPRAPPAPTFSSPFASPSLRWACKKRLRCLHPETAAALRLSPSPSLSPDRRPASPAAVVATPFGKSPSARPSLSLSPPHPSARARILIRLPSPRSDDAGEILEVPPDLPSRGASENDRVAGELSRGDYDGVGGIGWALRSAARNGEEKGKNKTRRRVEMWVSLSRDEIEEDFLFMTGAKPPRRCRRRDKGASDHFLMGLFPGSWMPNRVTVARYRVGEPSETRKV